MQVLSSLSQATSRKSTPTKHFGTIVSTLEHLNLCDPHDSPDSLEDTAVPR